MKHGLFLLLLLGGVAKAADAMPDFRGIRLGSTMTQAQIMHALGADKFKVDPDINIWSPPGALAEIDKHGMNYILEKLEFDIGPYCKNEGPQKFTCNNPRMVSAFNEGRSHGIRGTEIFVADGKVHSIDIVFDSLDEDEFVEAMYDKYGNSGWRIEKEPGMLITDLENKSSIQVERVTRNKKAHNYTIMITNHDMIFTHPITMNQGMMEIKVIDRNF
jgi:hypothetical protein